jgi:hypothetical protein
MVPHVRGILLPERQERSLWIDGGVLREDPVAGAETVADGGWLLPGLVDVHTHPGAEKPGDPFDESVLRTDLAEHAAAGVLLIRAPGSAARIPGWAHDAEGLPRVRSAGPWLATPGRFFPSWGRHVTEVELAGAAAEEAAAAQAAAWRPEAAGTAGGGQGPAWRPARGLARRPLPRPARPPPPRPAQEAREFSRTEGFSAGTRGSDAVIAVGVSQVPGWGRSHGASGSFTTGWRAQGALASWPPGWPVLSCDWHRAGSGWRVRPVRGCPGIGEADPFLHSVFQPLVG